MASNKPATDATLQQQYTTLISILGKLPANPANADQQVSNLAKLETLRVLLATIAGDTSSVQVNSIAGNGAYSNLGSPSVSASNLAGFSNPIVPNGERLRFRFGVYSSGDRTWAALTSGGFIWLEADLSGGTTYVPILGTKQLLSDLPVAVTSGFNAVFDRVPAGANVRVGINFGTIGGSSGLIGTNIFARN